MTAIAIPSNRRRAALSLARESIAPLGVAALALMVIAHLLGTGWLRYFLYDGDSLALPLLVQSLRAGEPFQWVMTSQIFLFPEIPLYLLSAAVAPSVQASLVINGILNVLVLYALLRWIAARVLRDRRSVVQLGVAFAATSLFLLICATEGRALVNTGSFAAGYLLTTYYGGVLMSGLACVALAFEAGAGSGERVRRRRLVLALAGLVLISALTTLSNPLFLVDVTAPLAAAVVLAWIVRRMPFRLGLLLVASLGIGSVCGYLARTFFADFIAVDAATYLHLDRAGTAVSTLLAQSLDVLSTRSGKAEMLLVGGLVLLALLGVGYAVFAQVRPQLRMQIRDSAFLLYAFVAMSAAGLVAVQVITGSEVSRYFVPLGVFPVLAIVALAAGPFAALTAVGVRRAMRGVRARVVRVAAATVAVLAVALAGVIGIPPVVAAADDVYSSPDEQCLDRWIDGRDLAGVGSFWTTRPLQLYGARSIDVQQVNFDFSAQVWMNNLYDYDGKTFSYVLADHQPDWSVLALSHLGEPAAVRDCGSFDVYDYAGTPGETALNEIVHASIDDAKEARGY